jgi:hypothetical protein
LQFRYAHSCGHIHSDETGLQFSIIVAGGFGASGVLSSVEILDQEATSWRSGLDLPIKVRYVAMVEDPLGKSF